VFIEEAFERLMLDYDRVFSSMGIPACLWRRTGEIYKGNREFAELVGVEGHMLRDVSLLAHYTRLIADMFLVIRVDSASTNSWQKNRR
jgi:PAS domain-containing protein